MSLSLTGVVLTVISYLLLTYVVFILYSLGSVHTTLDQFENAALFLQLGLASTLIRHDNNGFRKRYSKRRNLWTENTLEEEHGIPLACQILSQLMCFQIFPAKCRWGQDKRRSSSLCFVLKQETTRSKSFFLSGVLRKIQYRYWCGPFSKFPSSSWHLAATNLHGNKAFTFLISLISIKLNFLFVLFALFNLSTLELAVIGIHLCPTSGWASPLLLEQDISSSSPELMPHKTRWGEMFKIVVNFVFCLLNHSYRSICCAGCLCCHGGAFAVFSDGSFLLDARRGNLPLLVCCQGLQHRGQNAGVSSDFLG